MAWPGSARWGRRRAANVLLDEVDKALERRGHCFVRYADDANVYVRSRRSGERVMALLRRLYGKLRLTVNETKSAVASVFGRKFLGYGFWPGPGGVIKRKVAEKPLRTFKQRIRQLTCRSGGRSMQGCGGSSAALHPRMEGVLPAGANTTGLARARPVAASSAARHPAQAVEARTTMYRELLALGAKPGVAQQVAANSRRWWRNSGMLLNAVLTLKWSDRLGLPRLS
jgi:RNA-directed DNA polymerase